MSNMGARSISIVEGGGWMVWRMTDGVTENEFLCFKAR